MTLYYDKRIRPTLLERWAEANLPNMDFSGGAPKIPEEKIDPKDSALLKDDEVPLCFKNHIAQELYEAEEESIKEAVRLRRDKDMSIKTIYDVDEEDRLELVRDYHK